MTDYYLDASAATDGVGTSASPFKIINGKTFANYDRVWIRRTGITLPINNATLTLPTLTGFEMLAWPRVGEYGYYERDPTLTAWDADTEEYWLIAVTAGYVLNLNSGLYGMVRGGYLKQTHASNSIVYVQLARTTFSRCVLINVPTSTTSSNTFFQQGDTATMLTVSNSTLAMQYPSGGADLTGFSASSSSANFKLLNLHLLYTATHTTWYPGLFSNPYVAMTNSTIVLTMDGTGTMPAITGVTKYISPQNAYDSRTVNRDVKVTTTAKIKNITVGKMEYTDKIGMFRLLILKCPSVRVLESIVGTSRFQCCAVSITADAITNTAWDSTSAVYKPFTPLGTVSVSNVLAGGGIRDRLYIKASSDRTYSNAIIEERLPTNQWISSDNSGFATHCNVRRVGGGDTTLVLESTRMVYPTAVGWSNIPSRIYVGELDSPFTTLTTMELPAGTHTLTYYMADYADGAIAKDYHTRILTVRYCVNGRICHASTGMVHPDDSTWINDYDLVSYKQFITLTVAEPTVISVQWMHSDAYVAEAYSYLDTTVVVNTLP